MKNFPTINGQLHSVYDYDLGIKMQAKETYDNNMFEKNKSKVYQKNRTKEINKRVYRSRRGV